MFSTKGVVDVSMPSSERFDKLVDLRGDNLEMIPPSQEDMMRLMSSFRISSSHPLTQVWSYLHRPDWPGDGLVWRPH